MAIAFCQKELHFFMINIYIPEIFILFVLTSTCIIIMIMWGNLFDFFPSLNGLLAGNINFGNILSKNV